MAVLASAHRCEQACTSLLRWSRSDICSQLQSVVTLESLMLRVRFAAQQAPQLAQQRVPKQLQPATQAFKAAATGPRWQLPEGLMSDPAALVLLLLGGATQHQSGISTQQWICAAMTTCAAVTLPVAVNPAGSAPFGSLQTKHAQTTWRHIVTRGQRGFGTAERQAACSG